MNVSRSYALRGARPNTFCSNMQAVGCRLTSEGGLSLISSCRAREFLRDENNDSFDGTRGELLTFTWLARDECLSLVRAPRRSPEHFLFEHAGRWMSSDERGRALTHLELQ